MVTIIVYLIVWLLAVIGIALSNSIFTMPAWYLEKLIFIYCALAGAAGGILYCLRAIYINKCVNKKWDETWYVWYYLRPITSGISGFISCIFLKAGLMVLEATQDPNATMYGFYALAFIAGYNVDNFLKKLETIAQDLWGINKSRSSVVDSDSQE